MNNSGSELFTPRKDLWVQLFCILCARNGVPMDSYTAHIWFWHGGDPYAMQLVPLEKVPLVLCCFKEATAAVFFPTGSTSDRAQVPQTKGFSFSSASAWHVGSATSASATSQSSPLGRWSTPWRLCNKSARLANATAGQLAVLARGLTKS